MEDPAFQFLLHPKNDYVHESDQRDKRLSTVHELPSFTPITPKTVTGYWPDQNNAPGRMEKGMSSRPKNSDIAEFEKSEEYQGRKAKELRTTKKLFRRLRSLINFL